MSAGASPGFRSPPRSRSARSSRRPTPPPRPPCSKELRLPQRIGAVLQGESLLNDATALLIYRARGRHGGGLVLACSDGPLILLSAAGSLVAGYVLARLYLVLTSRIRDAASSTVLQFVSTFAVWLLAERLTLSPIITVVIYAMALAQAVPRRSSARLRISSYSVWETAIFVVNVLAFVLMGLQARHIIERLSEAERWGSLLFGLSVLAIVIATRIAWIAAYRLMIETARRWFNADLGARDPRGAILVSWSGMRGLVTLATAFALPLDFPGRDLIVLCAFCVVLGTLVIQGLTLRPLLHWLDFKDDGTVERELSAARVAIMQAALDSARRRYVTGGGGAARPIPGRAHDGRRREARRRRRPSTISSGCERSRLNGRRCIVCARNDKSATRFFTGSRKSSIGPSSTRRRPGAFSPSSAETASGKRRGRLRPFHFNRIRFIAVTVPKLRRRSSCGARLGGLGHTAGEIVEIALQLIERKAEREDALHAFQRQCSRQALAAQRGHFGGETVERGRDRVERRRMAARQQRGGAHRADNRPRFRRCARATVRARARNGSGNGSSRGPADHHEIVPQPQQCAQQRALVGLGGKTGHPLMPGSRPRPRRAARTPRRCWPACAGVPARPGRGRNRRTVRATAA
mgnify:CR=1 FL=1